MYFHQLVSKNRATPWKNRIGSVSLVLVCNDGVKEVAANQQATA